AATTDRPVSAPAGCSLRSDCRGIRPWGRARRCCSCCSAPRRRSGAICSSGGDLLLGRLPALDFGPAERAGRSHRAFRLHTIGREHVHAAADVRRVPGLAGRNVLRRRFVGMGHPGDEAVGDFGGTDDAAVLVEYPDEIVMGDPARGAIRLGYANDVIVMTFDAYAVVFEIVDGAPLAVLRGVKTEALMRRQKLDREGTTLLALLPEGPAI